MPVISTDFPSLRRPEFGRLNATGNESNARVIEPRLTVDATDRERARSEERRVGSGCFGGNAESGVPRNQVPTGYWSSGSAESSAPAQTGPVRRRARECRLYRLTSPHSAAGSLGA